MAFLVFLHRKPRERTPLKKNRQNGIEHDHIQTYVWNACLQNIANFKMREILIKTNNGFLEYDFQCMTVHGSVF